MLGLPQKMKRQNPNADPTAYQKVGPLPDTQIYIKFKRIKYDGGDLAKDKDNLLIQRNLDNLLLDAIGEIYREGQDPPVTGPLGDGTVSNWAPPSFKTLDPVFVKCSIYDNYRLSVEDAHKTLSHIRWGGHGWRGVEGVEITYRQLYHALSLARVYMAKDEQYGYSPCEFDIFDGEKKFGHAKLASTREKAC